MTRLIKKMKIRQPKWYSEIINYTPELNMIQVKGLGYEKKKIKNQKTPKKIHKKKNKTKHSRTKHSRTKHFLIISRAFFCYDLSNNSCRRIYSAITSIPLFPL